jgi:hypothetical protein
MSLSTDLTEQPFGRWTVVGIDPIRTREEGREHWLCVCVCGTERSVRARSLMHGLSTSCGCLRSESCRAMLLGNSFNLHHGHARHPTHSPEYRSWAAMVQRCTNPNNLRYQYYGGAGVVICDRWQTFENFLADLGPRTPGTTLGRFGDIGAYEPGNAKWMTQQEQSAEARRKGARIGCRHSAASRQKMSAALMGKKPWNTGKHHSAATRAKISAANKGNKSSVGRKHSAAMRSKRRWTSSSVTQQS